MKNCIIALTLLFLTLNSFCQVETKITASDGAASDQFGRAVSIDQNRIVVGASIDDDNGSNSGSIYVYDWNGSTWIETKVTASDGAASDQFGGSVSIDQDRIVVGAMGDGDNGNNSGSVYVYDWDGSTWIETKITASDGAADDFFGSAVSIYQNRFVVGADRDDDNGSNSGSVYVYEWDGVIWLESKITASDGLQNNFFGGAVSIDQDRFVVGAAQANGNSFGSGAVYYYEWDGSTWLENKITASDGQDLDLFGGSVSLGNNIIVAGANGDDDSGTFTGAVYYYEWDGSMWIENKITASDAAAIDHFGISVSVDQERFVIGAYGDDDNGSFSGSAYIYDYSNCPPTTKIIASDGTIDDEFGRSVSNDQDRIVVGAHTDDDNGSNSGSVYVYEHNGNTWQELKITASDGAPGALFGWAVSNDQDRIVVGAPLDNDNGSGSGSAYVYDWNGSVWLETKITASDGTVNDNFGISVSIDQDRIVIGAYGDDDNGSSSGSIYLYDWNGSTWVETKITASDGTFFDLFGWTVSNDQDRIVVGAYEDDDNGTNSGSTYIYEWDGSTWAETKITASDGSNLDQFGYSVSYDQNRIVVGARFDDDNGSSSGSVYVYEWDGSTWVGTKITGSDGAASDFFGDHVKMSQDRIVVGARQDDDNGTNSGSVYVYEWDGSIWVETKLIASDGAAFDGFGGFTSIDQDNIVVSAVFDDDNGSNSGSIYIYHLCDDSESNFTCSEAIEISDCGTYTAIGPSQGGGATSSDATNAVWFKFTPTFTGIVDIYSCLQGVDTRLLVHSGSCNNLSLVNANDDNCELFPGGDLWASELIGVPVTNGQPIYIEWDDRWSTSGFDFTIDCHSICPNNYSGINKLTGVQSAVADFETDGILQSAQIIDANVDYDSGTHIELCQGFEVKLGRVFNAFIDGCGNLFREEENNLTEKN